MQGDLLSGPRQAQSVATKPGLGGHSTSDPGRISCVGQLCHRPPRQCQRGSRRAAGAANAGRKVMALLFAMVLGADSIDDTRRAARGPHRAGCWAAGSPAPSTLGTFLRAFTFGHVRQLDALLGRALERAWKAGAGPGDGRLVIDVDSFVGEVCGRCKQGAAYGYTGVLGYHPILATRADTREALHIRLRKGSANTQKGSAALLRRADRPRRARPARPASSCCAPTRAFWNTKVFERLEQAGWQYSIGVRDASRPSARRSRRSTRTPGSPIDYPDDGEAQIAETMLRRAGG